MEKAVDYLSTEQKITPMKMVGLPLDKLPEAAMGYFKDPVETQNMILAEILQASKDTEFGEKYNFEAIGTREDFVKKVPLSSWADYAEYTRRMEEGEENILFPGVAEYFIKTSGTTGKNKFIPESTAGAAGKKAITSLRNAIQISAIMKAKGGNWFERPFSDFGHILTFSSSGDTGVTKGGIPIGFASGITSGRANEEFKKMYCCPQEILNIPDPASLDYMIMRFSLTHHNVIAVVGNNAGRFRVLLEYGQKNAEQLIKDIKEGIISENIKISDELRQNCQKLLKPNAERACELQALLDSGRENFIPKNYWKELCFCSFWMGSSVGVYVDEIRPVLPDDAIYYDVGYGASELKINVPMQPETPYGPLGTFVGFYEFLPKNGGEPVFIDGLADGEIYEIVVTTFSGLYRYKMGDYVQVKGKTGGTPNITFVSKTGEIASLANEKVTGDMIIRAAKQAVTESKCGHFVFCQVYPCPADKSYHCYIEIDGIDIDVEKLALVFDEKLKQTGEAYGRRRLDGSITMPVVHLMESGWQQTLYKGKMLPGVSQSQIKLPIVVAAPLK